MIYFPTYTFLRLIQKNKLLAVTQYDRSVSIALPTIFAPANHKADNHHDQIAFNVIFVTEIVVVPINTFLIAFLCRYALLKNPSNWLFICCHSIYCLIVSISLHKVEIEATDSGLYNCLIIAKNNCEFISSFTATAAFGSSDNLEIHQKKGN